MDTPRKRHLTLWSLAVVVGCLAEISAASYLLYLDMNLRGGAGRGTPLAKVERSEAKVRRKASGTYAWTQAITGEQLYRRDSIQTGPNSVVAIHFNDGSALEVSENSLVVIDDTSNMALSFVSGSVILKRADGTDSRITAGTDGKAKVEEIPVRLLEPQPLSRFFVASGAESEIKFTWKPRKPGRGPAAIEDENTQTLQISADRAFRPARTRSMPFDATSGETAELKAKLAPGRYFWRVFGKEKPVSSTAQFRVLNARPLAPLWPTQADRIETWGTDSSSVQFRWSAAQQDDDSNEARHTLEVARDAEFKEIVASNDVAADTGVASLKNVPTGPLHWRIRSAYPGVESISPVKEFSVERREKLTVELSAPDEQGAIEKLPKLRFAWNCASQDVEFSWELQTADGKNVTSAKLRSLTQSWDRVAAGTYRWRVTALLKGVNVGESPWRKLSVFEGKPLALKLPAKNHAIRYWTEAEPFNFSWDPDPLAQKDPQYKYHFELSQDVAFKARAFETDTAEATIPSARAKLGNGTWFWRVKLVDGGGQVLKVSEPSKFSMGVFPPLRAPASVKTAVGTTFNLTELEGDPVLAWDAVEGAEGYEVTVYDSAKAGKIAFQTVTVSPKAELKSFAEGNYAWSVRSIDRLKRRGEASSLRSFHVTYGEALAVPESMTPEVQ